MEYMLPCELIVKADGFDAWEIVHPGGGVATRTSCHQVAIGRFAAGAGLNSLQRPGEDIIQLRGFGELVHFLAFCLTDGWIMTELDGMATVYFSSPSVLSTSCQGSLYGVGCLVACFGGSTFGAGSGFITL